MNDYVKQSSAGYWDSMVGDFDAIYAKRSFLDRWLRRDIYERVDMTVELVNKLGEHQRVLDVGSGTGRLCIPLARSGHTVVGVDFSAGMLDQARHFAEAAGVADRCTFLQDDVVADGSRVVRPGERYDAVAILGVLDYISDPLPMLKRLLLLEPKLIIASFPRAGTLRAWLRVMRYRLQGLDCPLYFYTGEQIAGYAREMGVNHLFMEMGQLHFAKFSKSPYIPY
ncbi:MAG: class I SAM-dependent methyltransferase [Betaproteobacteria bacterium]|nr:MAG: class I SAM-dependent methyltransferase [Betaproteobacteria bacterium]